MVHEEEGYVYCRLRCWVVERWKVVMVEWRRNEENQDVFSEGMNGRDQKVISMNVIMREFFIPFLLFLISMRESHHKACALSCGK